MERRIKKTVQILCLVILLPWSAWCTGTSIEGNPDSKNADAAKAEPIQVSGQCRVRYAKGFAITYHEGYKVITVFEPGRTAESKGVSTFVLVPRGRRPPPSVEGMVVEIPVQRVALRSASHVPFFSMLGITDRIIAITQGKYVNDPVVTELIRQSRIAEVGVGSGMTAQFDVERLLVLHPDLILSWWTNNPAFAGHIKAQEAGMPVVLLSDYEENTPLGRTEWIKFVAAFFNAEARAERIFNNIEQRYLSLAAKTKNVDHTPTVVYGSSYQGVWYIAGGKSYIANLIKDAGGEYIWNEDNTTSSKPVNMEAAILQGRDAEYWITQNQNYFSLASIIAEDDRYRLFKSFRTGRVYSTNGKIGHGGGNDYYQGTTSCPDLLLADMIAILHPEILGDHELIWHLHLQTAALTNETGTMRQRK